MKAWLQLSLYLSFFAGERLTGWTNRIIVFDNEMTNHHGRRRQCLRMENGALKFVKIQFFILKLKQVFRKIGPTSNFSNAM